LDWSVGGFAADPPTLGGAFADASNTQLLQAMANFGSSGAAASSSALTPAAETAQQPFLTAPQHA
jgi:hypothetical protein